MTSASLTALLAADPLGPHMAGPAQRAWQLAGQLAALGPVELWYEGTLPAAPPPGLRPRPFHPELFRSAAEGYSAAILPAQWALRDHTLFDLPCVRIIDCYAPFPIETAALLQAAGPAERRFRTRLGAWAQALAVVAGDAWLVAHAGQRDWLLGLLTLLGRVTPAFAAEQAAGESRIIEVPFGLTPIDPTHEPPVPPADFPVPADAPYLLWTGGLWPWLDPVRVIKAFNLLAGERTDLHLVIPGMTSPHGTHPESSVLPALQAAVRTSPVRERIHLLPWIAAADWAGVAAWAALHVSAHQPGPEAALSWRTRYLEAVRWEVPLACSPGDPLGTELARQGVAHPVLAGTPEKAAAGLASALAAPEVPAEIWRTLQQRYAWETAVQPLAQALARGIPADREREAHGGEIAAWLAQYPIPQPPGKLQKLWELVRKRPAS